MKKSLTVILIFLLSIQLFSATATPISELTKQLNQNYLQLVNRTNKVSADFVPQDLVTFSGSNYKLNRVCATALSNMISACQNAVGGEKPVLYSGYRSYARQYEKYYGKINQYIANGYSKAQATALTDEYYAPPGGSEHHTGLAADICTPSIVNRYGQLHEAFANTKQGIWLKQNCHKYGFILRYEKGKESITGYNYEPWHFRYIGIEHATAMVESKLTFEEYHKKLSTIQKNLSTGPKLTVSGSKISFTSPINTTIRYTSNCKTPTLSSAICPKSLSKTNTTYKAIACMDGYTSAVTTVTITKYGDVFTDFTVKDWFYDIVSLTVKKEIFNGIGNHQFAPQENMTRAMLVQVIANLNGVNLNAYKSKPSYKDVGIKKWYAPAIAWAKENEIVNGMGNNLFAPEAPITREQCCVIFYNNTKSKAETVPLAFTDKNQIAAWSSDAVSFCAAKNIVSGYPDGTFRPKEHATRAQVARIALSWLDIQ